MQKPDNDTAFAFPGGHVAFGETNAQTLVREFREEIGADISVGELKWVGEVFFPWGDKPCHQICLYYSVEIEGDDLARKDMFMGKEHIEGRNFEIEFHWIPLEDLKKTEVYPTNTAELISRYEQGVQHFIYRE